MILWRFIPFAIFLSVWKERNNRIFQSVFVAVDDLEQLVVVQIAKWTSFKEFDTSKVYDVLHKWEASLYCGVKKVKKVVHWVPPNVGVLKFNVDGVAKGKPGPAGISGVLRDSGGLVLVMFSKHVGTMESNEAEVLAILEAVRIFASSSFNSRLEVKSDSLNVISWVSSSAVIPWRFQFYLNEIRVLTFSIQVKFQHVRRSANGFADSLAKQGVDRSSNLMAFTV